MMIDSTNKLVIIEAFNDSESFIAIYNDITLYVNACRGRMWTTIQDSKLNWVASFKRSWHPMPYNATIEQPQEKYSDFLMLFNKA
jgi:hypothetical protein